MDLLVQSIFEDVVGQFQSITAGDGTCLEGLLLALESLMTYVVHMESVESQAMPSGGLSEVIDTTRDLTRFVEELIERQKILQVQQHHRGRPKLQILETQLRELLQFHFSVVSISQLFSCSTKTVYR